MLLFVIIVLVCPVYSQLSVLEKEPISKVVGNVEAAIKFVAQLRFQTSSSENPIYTLILRDFRYSNIKAIDSIKFVGSNGIIKEFVDLMKTFFSTENLVIEKVIRLGNETLIISREGGHVKLLHGKSYGLLTEKQLNKLFSKVIN